MTENLRDAIRAMRENTLPTKSGVVRSLLADIEDALIAGYRLKAIWQCVRANGLEVTYPQFCVYLKRAKAKPRQSAAASGKNGVPETSIDRGQGFDPLANIRRRQSVRPGFRYRGTENLDMLVHGRKNNDSE
jgi:hypothetical protein